MLSSIFYILTKQELNYAGAVRHGSLLQIAVSEMIFVHFEEQHSPYRRLVPPLQDVVHSLQPNQNSAEIVKSIFYILYLPN